MQIHKMFLGMMLLTGLLIHPCALSFAGEFPQSGNDIPTLTTEDVVSSAASPLTSEGDGDRKGVPNLSLHVLKSPTLEEVSRTRLPFDVETLFVPNEDWTRIAVFGSARPRTIRFDSDFTVIAVS
jgi:hypothetical protein